MTAPTQRTPKLLRPAISKQRRQAKRMRGSGCTAAPRPRSNSFRRRKGQQAFHHLGLERIAFALPRTPVFCRSVGGWRLSLLASWPPRGSSRFVVLPSPLAPAFPSLWFCAGGSIYRVLVFGIVSLGARGSRCILYRDCARKSSSLGPLATSFEAFPGPDKMDRVAPYRR